MKIIKLYYLLFISIVLLFKFNKSQLSQDNNNVQLYEFKENVYQSYPIKNFTVCQFSNKYAIQEFDYEILDLGVLSIVDNILTADISVPSSNTFIETFQIMSNTSGITEFTIKLFCDPIIDQLNVSLLSEYPDIDYLGNIYFYVSIKGLKHSLSNGLELESSVGLASMPVNRELYLVYVTDITYYDSGIQFIVRFPNFNTSLVLKPFYDTSIPISIDVSTNPAVSAYSEPGYNMPASMFIQIDSSNRPYLLLRGLPSSPSIPKLAYQIGSIANGDLHYIYKDSLRFSLILYDITYNLIYNNGEALDSLAMQFKSTRFTLNQTPVRQQIDVTSSIIVLQFNSSGYTFRNCVYKHEFKNQFGTASFTSNTPFGFIKRNIDSTFTHQVSYPLKKRTAAMDTVLMTEFPSGTGSPTGVIISPSNDVIPPTINSLAFTHLFGKKYQIRIGASDVAGVLIFKFNNINHFAIESLVSGNINNGVFEFVVDLGSPDFEIYDYYYNFISVKEGDYLYTNNSGYFVYYTPPIYKGDQFIIENVWFLNNDIDVYNKPNYNTVYFNSTFDKNAPLYFRLMDDVSLNLNRVDNGFVYPVYYDEQLKCFAANFIIPKNTNLGRLLYSIGTPGMDILSGAFNSTLRTIKTAVDVHGPIVSKIVNANTFNKVGWRFTIADQNNGFEKGYVRAIGSVDLSIFNFNFTVSDTINSSGTSTSGDYDFIIDVQQPCITQDYEVDYIYLEDSNGIKSIFSKFLENSLDQDNPMMMFASPSFSLKSKSTCESMDQDTSPPELVSFIVNTPTVDVGSLNRVVSFNFSAIDVESGIMLTQRPKVYLTSYSYTNIECESTRILGNFSYAAYYCEMELPFGYGFDGQNDILLSVYGFINNLGYYSGYSNYLLGQLPSIKSTTIKPSFTLTPILLGYQQEFYIERNQDLVLYGRALSSINMATITREDNSSIMAPLTKVIGGSVLIISRNNIPKFNDEYFYIEGVVAISNFKTNKIKIKQSYFKYIPPETETPVVTPTPTSLPVNNPKECQGDPVCGGPSNGICVSNQGCVCQSPWIGLDCLSQVIIIDQPKTNESSPSTNITLPTTKDNNNNNSSIVVTYKSLISLVSIREVNILGKEVYSKSFKEWHVKQLDNTTFVYNTTLEIEKRDQLSQVNITVTLKWFTQETIVTFANEQLSMNPSTMKYTIEIGRYPFDSALNQLQVVMSASIQSDSSERSVCSVRDYGETTSGDNANYLKIQVDDHSLYGRFIRRGIVDSTITAITNVLLDKDMNSISETTQLQSYIGIQIPNFEDTVIIDPDFSVLLDSKSASSKSNAICSNKDSKLSGSKLAGLIIGCIAFVAVVVISITYYIIKKKKSEKFFSAINLKMKQMDINK